jgi:amino acid adenylation domain-containing protein
LLRGRDTVHDWFRQQATATPRAVALCADDETLDYSQLQDRADRLAGLLRTRGVGPSDLVAVCLHRSTELVVTLLAILQAGAAYLPLEPRHPRAWQRLVIGEAAPRLVVTTSELADRIDRPAEVLLLDDARTADPVPAGAGPRAERGTGDDPAYLMYTSGSTGRPKGVLIRHRSVVNLAVNADYVRLDADQCVLQLAPVSFDASTFEIWAPLLNGARLALAPPGPLATERLGQVLRRHAVTTLWLTAPLFHRVVDDDVTALQPVSQVLTGGDVVSARHVRSALAARRGRRVVNGYGPTETTTFACCYVMTDPQAVPDPVPIGRPIHGVIARVVDRDGSPVGWNEPGELCIGGAGVGLGYLHEPELTRSRFVFAPADGGDPEVRSYRTGDRVQWLPDGNLAFLGRMDDQVKVRGHRVEPREIEQALTTHAAVRQAAVVAVPTAAGDRRLVAYVVGDQAACEGSALRRYLAGLLPSHLVPSTVRWLAALPLGPTEKVDRLALAALAPVPDVDGEPEPLAEPADAGRAVRQIWADVLGVEHVPDGVSFLDLGGDSLGAITVASRILAAFGVEVELWTILDADGLHEFVDEIVALRQQGS